MTEPYNVLVESKYGPMLVNKNDQYVGGSLLKYGEYSDGEVQLFRALLKPGMVIVVVGAHFGALTIPLAQLCTPGPCFAFEPQRTLYEGLVANVALNSLHNVHASNIAVGDCAGTVVVPQLDPRAAQNFGALEIGKATQGTPVGIIRLDDLQLQHLHLLFADCEGMEAAVLRGARETIERCLPMIYVEADREPQRPELLALLTDMGYAAYWHVPPLFNPLNFKGEQENIFEGVVSLNWFCIPEEREIAPGWERVTQAQLDPSLPTMDAA